MIQMEYKNGVIMLLCQAQKNGKQIQYCNMCEQD